MAQCFMHLKVQSSHNRDYWGGPNGLDNKEIFNWKEKFKGMECNGKKQE